MKILFTDLDGTLLNDEKTDSRLKFHSRKKTLSKGKCWGDSQAALIFPQKFVDRLGLNQEGCYAILYNGGMIW